MRSTLKPPPLRALQRFHLGQIGDDTVGTYLANGFSLAICCRTCMRLVEWTPPDLQRRFGGRPDLPIAELAARLACSDEGCGSRDVAVFPHLYDGPSPPPPDTG